MPAISDACHGETETIGIFPDGFSGFIIDIIIQIILCRYNFYLNIHHFISENIQLFKPDNPVIFIFFEDHFDFFHIRTPSFILSVM